MPALRALTGARTKDKARMDSDAGHDLEAGVCEVAVEGECPVQIVAAHEGKRHAVGANVKHTGRSFSIFAASQRAAASA